MTDLNLTNKDIEALRKGQSFENKSSTIRKVSHYYTNNENKSLTGKQLAEDIFRIMIRDIEVKIRSILADSLKNSRNLPKDIVHTIISDVEAVSTSFIRYYHDLSDLDLIGIIESNNIKKQKAVASRYNLSKEVSHFICEWCSEDVIKVLISNESANIAENTFENIIDKYKDNEKIQETLVYRPQIPVSILSKLTNSLSDELKKRLIMIHNLPENMASDLVDEIKEKTTLKISEEYSSDKQIDELVKQLYKSDRLTPSLVVRSICMGDLKFFEYALSYLANTSLTEIRKILFNNQADFVIRNLLRKAFIPKEMFPAVFSALNIIKDIRYDCTKTNRETFVHKVIERILSVNNADEDISENDINYLISKIS